MPVTQTMRYLRQSPFLLVFIALLLGLPLPTNAASPQVVVSIKPIHSLVAGVMAGVAEPELLISGAQSPHTYHLRPSDVRKLASAGLVVWVGESLETPLAKVLAANAAQANILEIMSLSELVRLPIRRGGVWSAHEHGNHDEHHHLHDVDNHVWLTPSNAKKIVTATAHRLSRIDPEHAGSYQRNAQQLQERIDTLDKSLRQRLALVGDRPFIVFHDAYQYFERHFGLHGVGSVTASPEQLPGARRIHELRQEIQQRGAVCIFSEPQFEPKLVRTLVAGTQIQAATLDPLGVQLQAGPELYFQLMSNLGDVLLDCLAGKGK